MDLQHLKRRAEEGSCAAQTTLGLDYLYGVEGVVDVDLQQAYRLLSAAADQGASRAVANLGHMHAQGLGVPKDVPKAIQLYERVGHVEFFAAIELGRIFSRGVDAPVDHERALRWYSTAASFATRIDDCEDELEEAKSYISWKER